MTVSVAIVTAEVDAAIGCIDSQVKSGPGAPGQP
jgi:kynureninase